MRPDMASEFSFERNGRRYNGATSEFELFGAEESKLAARKSLIVRLRYKELGLEVDAIYNSYDRHPAIRKHLVLRNAGASALRFTHLNIEALGLSLGSESETILAALDSIAGEKLTGFALRLILADHVGFRTGISLTCWRRLKRRLLHRRWKFSKVKSASKSNEGPIVKGSEELLECFPGSAFRCA